MLRHGERVQLQGELTLQTARRLLEDGAAAIAAGARIFDFAAVDKVDSSALSLMLAWRRRAQASGVDLRFENLPASLCSLARLYGVDTLLLPSSANSPSSGT